MEDEEEEKEGEELGLYNGRDTIQIICLHIFDKMYKVRHCRGVARVFSMKTCFNVIVHSALHHRMSHP